MAPHFLEVQAQSSTSQKLQQVVSDYSYTCGAKLEDINLGDEFKDVEVHVGTQLRNFTTQLISSQYVSTVQLNKYYPQCEACAHLPQIKSDVYYFSFHCS